MVYYVYILTNRSKTLYVGVTSNLVRRIWQHKEKRIPGFTRRDNLDRLVYYEVFGDVRAAIRREKQIKGWLRARKMALIASLNPQWQDLGPGLHTANAQPAFLTGVPVRSGAGSDSRA